MWFLIHSDICYDLILLKSKRKSSFRTFNKYSQIPEIDFTTVDLNANITASSHESTSVRIVSLVITHLNQVQNLL